MIRDERPHTCPLFHLVLSIDHGFYCFNPLMLYNYYGVNGFGEFECYLMELDLSDVTWTYANQNRCITYEYRIALNGVLDTSEKISTFFAPRKQVSLTQLTVSTQGFYVCRGNLTEGLAEVPQPAFDRRIPGWLKTLANPVYPLLRLAYRKHQQAQACRAAIVKNISGL